MAEGEGWKVSAESLYSVFVEIEDINDKNENDKSFRFLWKF